jgi:hypothetical protein
MTGLLDVVHPGGDTAPPVPWATRWATSWATFTGNPRATAPPDIVGHARAKRYFGIFPPAHEKRPFYRAFLLVFLGENRVFL